MMTEDPQGEDDDGLESFPGDDGFCIHEPGNPEAWLASNVTAYLDKDQLTWRHW